MLDDLKMIHERDADDALGVTAKESSQLRHDFTFTPAFKAGTIHNVVFVGMGGSALAALCVPTWPKTSKPFEVVRGYDIPDYVGKDTLFIASSYSGNTEEAIEALENAAEKGAQIVVIAGGGKLAEMARDKGYPLTVLPAVPQPRFAVFYSFKALVTLLSQAGAASVDMAELEKAADFLDQASEVWLPTVPASKNPAKSLAQECIGRSVVIYAGPKLAPAAYKWKISFNENAKQIAWWNQFPEFNHNEFLGWTKQPEQKPYVVIDLRSKLERGRVQKRFDVTERLLSGMRPAPHVVEVQGKNELQQLLWAVMFGDFVTIYTALLSGQNPAPVDLIEKFKVAMND